jgi:hypothetical protein
VEITRTLPISEQALVSGRNISREFFAHLSGYYNPLELVTFLFDTLYRVDVKMIDQYWIVGGRKLEAETEIFGYLSQSHFVNDKSHMTWYGIEPGPARWEAGD